MRALAVALLVSAAPRTPPAAAPAPAPPPTVEAVFEHVLSGATGPIPLTWPRLLHDAARGETYVLGEGLVRIFNGAGMEIHRFGDDGTLGELSRVAVLESGELLVLGRLEGQRALVRCDYKGEPLGRLELKGLPGPFSDLEPDRLVHRGGKLYLAESGTTRVVVTDLTGAHLRSFRVIDLVATVLAVERAGGMDGFNVDAAGNVLFTMSPLFTAGVVSPQGELRLFGARGSRPGTFNIPGGIDADEAGNVYVTDRLRSAVSVWSPDLRFLGEFGYRGEGYENLITPYEIAAGNGRVFVAQAAGRGVKVFRVQLVPSTPGPPRGEAVAPALPPQRSSR